MKIKLTSVYVDNQEKALRFYTDVLGFTKKADFRNGPFRWLTVTSPDEADGTELQLALRCCSSESCCATEDEKISIRSVSVATPRFPPK
jgi:catechol 2,3-dioxygenase-like lactoylglutathione lyase family enzyme